MDVVIVGFGTGAVGAIRAILGADRDTDIVVVDRKGFDTYSPCGMPYVLAGEVEEHKVLKHSFPENGRLKKFSETEVISIDRKKKLVRVRGAGGAEEVIAYSSLILDTGAMPLVPSIPFKPSLLGKGIYTFTRPMDLDRLLEALPDIERAAVVGGGAIGLELAQALHAR
ncbi:MAG: NAD(P)/FAD-dependent oxidoreductase, partial [Thermoplasmata archaeon]|nr:NAD(P)/FAD-dependent oxidoreductase [Thermoplasmata archaeon]